MGNAINSYSSVMDRFPEQQDAIRNLCSTDPHFQKLCKDYRQCAKALDFWRRSPLCEAPKRKQGYETLLAELESKILQYISNTADLSAKNTSTGV